MVTCYAQPEKAKSMRVLEAFAKGCGGAMATTREEQLLRGDAAFYGVRTGWVHLWVQAINERRTWWLLDNSFFDAAREGQFRIGHNAMQSWRPWPSDGKRLAALGVKVQPWRKSGAHVVVAAQSDEFMKTIANEPGWTNRVTARLQENTDRQILVRTKATQRPLLEDLKNAWLLVAHSSAAAVEALIAGIPVICTEPSCAMARFTSTFSGIESPAMPGGREEWAARLADSQFSLDEMRAGHAWREVQSWQ